MGVFFGFKLHLICNQQGELVRLLLTSENKADNDERVLKTFLQDLQGTFYGDKGYISQLKPYFQEKQIKLITKVRKNMFPEKLSKAERYFLGKRTLIETVIEHTRHRNPKNFFVKKWAGIIAYKFLDKKPAIQDYKQEIKKIELFKISQLNSRYFTNILGF